MDDKRQLRVAMRAARRAASRDAAPLSFEVAERVLALPEVKRSTFLLCYIGIRDELPTRRLVDRLLGRVAVPQITPAGLRAHLLTDVHTLVPGAFGVPTCDGPDVTDLIEVSLTPGLAFTALGARLGYGGGHYDRFLERHPGVVPIGLCYDVQVVHTLPVQPHDRPMQIIVTPTRTIRVGLLPEAPREP